MRRPLNRTGHSGGKGSLRQRCLSIRFQIQLAYQPGPPGRFKIDEAGEVGRGSTERLDTKRREALDHIGAQLAAGIKNDETCPGAGAVSLPHWRPISAPGLRRQRTVMRGNASSLEPGLAPHARAQRRELAEMRRPFDRPSLEAEFLRRRIVMNRGVGVIDLSIEHLVPLAPRSGKSGVSVMIVSNAFRLMELPRNAACAEGAEPIVAERPRLHNQQMAANASWSRNEPSRPKFRCQGTPRL